MQSALERKDFSSLRIAKIMISSADEMNDKLEKKEHDLQKFQKNIDKEKGTLLKQVKATA